MNIIPSALGESGNTLVLWDDCPDIGVALPRSPQLISELQWGAGSLEEGQHCLILYLFFGEDTAQVYLPEELPTSPTDSVAVWSVFLRRDPELLKVRYGPSPLDADAEITLLLPNREGERLADRLRAFIERLATEQAAVQTNTAITTLCQRLSVILEESVDAPRES